MALADLLKSSGTYIKWDDRGQGNAVTGSIVSIVDRQSRKYQTEDLDFWDDGAPKLQWIVTIESEERHEDGEDDGIRVIVVNQWSGQKKAMITAIRNFNGKEPEAGDTFTAAWTSGVGKAGDPRLFEYSFSKTAPASMKKLAAETPAAVAAPAGETTNKADEAKALLAAGIPAADVSEATGLNMKIVNALASQI